MTFVIATSVIVLLLVLLLFLPIIVCIDTKSNQYYIQLKGLFKASLETHKTEIFRIRMKFLFLNFYVYPLKIKSKKDKGKIKKEYQRRYNKSFKIIRFFRLLKTFKIKKLFMNIDTGNITLNANLYPLFCLLNYKAGRFYINFIGKNELVLIVNNRPINIIKSFVNF